MYGSHETLFSAIGPLRLQPWFLTSTNLVIFWLRLLMSILVVIQIWIGILWCVFVWYFYIWTAFCIWSPARSDNGFGIILSVVLEIVVGFDEHGFQTFVNCYFLLFWNLGCVHICRLFLLWSAWLFETLLALICFQRCWLDQRMAAPSSSHFFHLLLNQDSLGSNQSCLLCVILQLLSQIRFFWVIADSSKWVHTSLWPIFLIQLMKKLLRLLTINTLKFQALTRWILVQFERLFLEIDRLQMTIIPHIVKFSAAVVSSLVDDPRRVCLDLLAMLLPRVVALLYNTWVRLTEIPEDESFLAAIIFLGVLSPLRREIDQVLILFTIIMHIVI